MSFLNQLLESHGSQISESLTSHLGIPGDQADAVLPKVAPLVLGGLARQAQKNGPQAVADILQEHGDESALTDTSSFLEEQSRSEDPLGGLSSLLGGGGGGLGGLLGGGGALAGLLGGNLGDLASGALGDYLGLDKGAAGKVLPMLVPLIMAALRRQLNPTDEDTTGTASVLEILKQEGDSEALDNLVSGFLGGGGLGGLFKGN